MVRLLYNIPFSCRILKIKGGSFLNRIPAAHIRESDRAVQSIRDHLKSAAKLAEHFGNKFNSGDFAYICALMHDIGKYSEKFQQRIYEGGNRVDHSTAGAVEISKKLDKIGFLLAYCIAGHHGGLPDGGSRIDTADEPTLYGRLKKKIEPYERYLDEIQPENYLPKRAVPIKPSKAPGFSLAFYIRMLFSCVVDSDFLDTEQFMNKGAVKPDRKIGTSIDSLNAKLDRYLESFKNPSGEINKKRNEILECCIKKSSCNKGIYTLTVPTGGGKTISSLAFALKHAAKHRMDRVIYVIPYNSIIEQNAQVFKNILGEENVLEHHSNFSYDDDNEIMIKYRLAAENWDMPVIVTTSVQFFESLFANKASKCRKLHNIANSVVIFDEAQMLPIPYLLPCVYSIAELVNNYGCSIVLCSATQPAIGSLFPERFEINEICDNTKELFNFFRRTRLIGLGEIGDKELAGRLNAEKQVLCIVNTRKHAQNLFRLLDKEGSYHLSTLMYPNHRKAVLQEIRERLKEGLPCRVVSTSLIEAGVDIDFPVVYRAEAGLDSEIQAAGRCNREGKRGISPVYIFKPSVEYRRQIPEMLRRPFEVSRSISSRFDDISSPEAIYEYFSELYKIEGTRLDIHEVVRKFNEGLEKSMSFPFAEVAEIFKLIDNSTYPIIIPETDEAKELVGRLKNGERDRNLLRKIQQYTVNVYKNSHDFLFGAGSLDKIDEEISILTDIGRYDHKTGLDIGVESGQAIFV